VSKRAHRRASSATGVAAGVAAARLRRLGLGFEQPVESDEQPPASVERPRGAPWTPVQSGSAGRLREAWSARLPAGLRLGVVDPGRRGLVVLGFLALAGAVIGGWFFLQARPSEAEGAGGSSGAFGSAAASAAVSLPPLPSSWATLAAAGSGVAANGSAERAKVVVDVVGRVRRPGVFEVDAGSRIDDVITAAGGALPGTDLTALDLAASVTDGEEIFVGIPPPSGAAAASAGGVVAGPGAAAGDPSPSAPAVVNLNSAGLTELETLPGVGAVLGQRILDWRAAHGRFGSVVQLQQVSGIGPAKYAALVGRVSV
jgi:competence protein ComEA